jgi:hypothetical protein
MEEVTGHLLRIEGINFAATLYDTNDISTIRGAGLALLEAGATVRNTLTGLANLNQIFVGASQAAFVFSADAKVAAAALAKVRKALAETRHPPLRHLMFVADLAPLADFGTYAVEAALRAAEARNRAGQFRCYTVKLPDGEIESPGPDPFDHVSQATHDYSMQDGETRKRASSVIDRHEFGRKQRQKFYERADGEALLTCASLQEIVDHPPPNLPASVKGKLAYLYADGNRFGSIRAEIGTKEFAARLEELQTPLLQRITAWLRQGLTDNDRARAAPIKETSHARFETLLWGGDEFLFVIPAWLALPVLGELVTAMTGWKIGGRALTFAFGLVICDVKAPVRQARDTAHALAETVKEAMGKEPRSGAAIQVYESQSLIDAPLATQRSLAFALPRGQIDALDAKLVIAAEALPGLASDVGRLTDEGAAQGALSASLLHAAIMAARTSPGGLLSPDGEAAAKGVLQAAFERFGQVMPTATIAGFGERGLVLDLCLIAMLRDYCVSPWDGPQPSLSERVT